MEDSDILEEHVVVNESVNIHNVAIKWEAHSASIENTVSISNILISIVAVINQNSIAVLAPNLVDIIDADSSSSTAILAVIKSLVIIISLAIVEVSLITVESV